MYILVYKPLTFHLTRLRTQTERTLTVLGLSPGVEKSSPLDQKRNWKIALKLAFKYEKQLAFTK